MFSAKYKSGECSYMIQYATQNMNAEKFSFKVMKHFDMTHEWNMNSNLDNQNAVDVDLLHRNVFFFRVEDF